MEPYSKSGLWMIHSYQRDRIQSRRQIPSAGSCHIHWRCLFLTGWGGSTTSCQQFLQGDTFLSDNKLCHVAALTGTRIRSPSNLSHKLCLANWINYSLREFCWAAVWIQTNTQELLSFAFWTTITGCMCPQEEVAVWWLTYKAGDGAMKIFCLTFGEKGSGERIICRIKQ